MRPTALFPVPSNFYSPFLLNRFKWFSLSFKLNKIELDIKRLKADLDLVKYFGNSSYAMSLDSGYASFDLNQSFMVVPGRSDLLQSAPFIRCNRLCDDLEDVLSVSNRCNLF